MIFISILILLVAKALPFISSKISNIYFTRISTMVFIYAGVLTFNTFYIQSIGSGIGIYSGLFHITNISVLIEFFLLLIGSIILIAWPLFNKTSILNLSGVPVTRRGEGHGFLRINRSAFQEAEFSEPEAKKEGELDFFTYRAPDPYSNKKNKNPSIFTLVPLGDPLGSGSGTASADLNSTKPYSVSTVPVDNRNYSTDYSLIVLFSTLGSCLLISSSDLISMYLSIELQSFGLYILSTLYRDSESSTKAGLKYFLLGGLSSCLILLGAGLIYAYTGLTNFESIYSLTSVIGSPLLTGALFLKTNILQGLYLGIILIIIGFLFKISAAPLHNWSPDVYDETPTIVTIWLTVMPKIAILIFLLEFITNLCSTGFSDLNISSLNLSVQPLYGADPVNRGHTGCSDPWILKNLLLVSSLLSLIIGTVVGLAQTRIKRLLAYSTISHIGFILLALLINTEQSIDSLLFYIIQYSITNLNIFLILIALSYIINKSPVHNASVPVADINYISELKEQFILNPLLSLSLSICLFSMAGIPPLIGFFSKQFVLYSAIQNGYYFISIVAIIVSVISASYYLKIIKVMNSKKDSVQGTDQGYDQILRIQSDPTVRSEISNNQSERNFTARGINLLYIKNIEKASYSEPTGHQNLNLNLNLNHPGCGSVNQNKVPLTNFHSFLISTLTLIILLFILKPSLILNSTQLLSLSLFNF